MNYERVNFPNGTTVTTLGREVHTIEFKDVRRGNTNLVLQLSFSFFSFLFLFRFFLFPLRTQRLDHLIPTVKFKISYLVKRAVVTTTAE